MSTIVFLPDILPADVADFERLLPGFHCEALRRGWLDQYRNDEQRWVRVDPVGFEAFAVRESKPRDLRSLLEYAQSLTI